MDELVRYGARDGLATLTLNRPERRNAATPEMFEELLAAVAEAEADRSVRVLVLTGAGDDFCVGGDVSNLRGPGLLADADGGEGRLLRASAVVSALRNSGKPSVAVVRGGCAGAGLSLALACDLRYVASDAVVNTAFLSMALSGDCGINWLLTDTVGPGRARELMLLPEKLTGTRAHEAGLFTAVAGPGELDGLVAQVTARLAAAAPLAVAALRRNLDAARALSLEEFLPEEARRVLRLFRTSDAAEARAAFAERRAPVFTGT